MISAGHIEKAVKLMESGGANYAYFFNKINTPDWIEPLREKGLFKNPPSVTSEGAADWWPESRYLVRMAGKDPKQVLGVIEGIPATDNFYVRTDIIQTALNMPADCASQLAGKVKMYMHDKFARVYAEELCELVVHLLKGGEIKAGIDVAKEILDVEAVNQSKFRNVQGRVDGWRYLKAVEGFVPAFCEFTGIEGLKLFRDLLIKAIRLDKRSEAESREDYLYISQKRIEVDVYPDMDVRRALVKGLRELCKGVIEINRSVAKEVVARLQGQPYVVFDRIEMFLLRVFPEGQEKRIEEILSDRGYYNNHSARTEYHELLKRNFGSMGTKAQERYLEYVAERPNVNEEKVKWKRFLGREITEEDVLKHWRYEKLQRLEGLSDVLPEQWKGEYDSLVEEFGEPKRPGEQAVSASWGRGHESPISAEELETKSVEEIIEYLRTWEAPDEWEWGKVCPSGLADEVAKVIEKRFEEFCDNATQFIDLEATYVRTFLRVVETKCREGLLFSWEPILELSIWVANQPLELLPFTEGRDNDWSGAQDAVEGLIELGVTRDKDGIPFEYRKLVWECIEPITRSPDPTPEREEQSRKDNANFEPNNLAINSTRGRALEGVVQYGWWAKNNLSEGNVTLDNFEGIEEVRTVFEEHLDVEKEPLLAIRAIYGHWFPQLMVLGKKWAEEKTDIIFPSTNKNMNDFMCAAWDSYIKFCNVYDNVFQLLRDKYSWAIDRMKNQSERKGRDEDVDEQLARHLVVMYTRRVLSCADELWQKFWEEAPDRIRKEAIEFIGRMLRDPSNSFEVETIKKLCDLLEDRLKKIEAIDEKERSGEEFTAFGWWFECEVIEEEWLLEQLERVLILTKGRIDWGHKVVERLNKMFEKHPKKVLVVLRKMSDGDYEGWSMISNKEVYEDVLRRALKSENSEVKSCADDFVNHLGAMGYQEFRKLLGKEEISGG